MRPRIVLSLGPRQAVHAPAAPVRPAQCPTAPQHVWEGVSGRDYTHCVYGLIECPPLPAASYILVRRDQRGARTALRVGVAASEAPTLNLAQVRQQGAQAGANEVHVCSAGSDAEHRLVACDLRVSLFGTLAAEASPAMLGSKQD
jgi:hypothetical protein